MAAGKASVCFVQKMQSVWAFMDSYCRRLSHGPNSLFGSKPCSVARNSWKDGSLFLLKSSAEEYVEAASLLISDRDYRGAVGSANACLAEEFLLDPYKMSQSFDRFIDEYRL